MALGPIRPPSWLTWSSFFPSLALSSLNKHAEAVAYYKKALELDPDNDTYKSNLKIAELKLREAPSPVSLSLEGDDGGPGWSPCSGRGKGSAEAGEDTWDTVGRHICKDDIQTFLMGPQTQGRTLGWWVMEPGPCSRDLLVCEVVIGAMATGTVQPALCSQ